MAAPKMTLEDLINDLQDNYNRWQTAAGIFHHLAEVEAGGIEAPQISINAVGEGGKRVSYAIELETMPPEDSAKLLTTIRASAERDYARYLRIVARSSAAAVQFIDQQQGAT